MKSLKELTYLQKVALRGEVAYTVSTCAHNAEMKLRMYLILKDIDAEYKPFIVNEFKSSVTMDESEVDRIYYETLLDRVPTWLWVEKTIEDIKASVYLVPAKDQGALLGIDKVEERKKIIESAFIYFARNALMICPDASEKLFENILEDQELDFLHTACFYLKSCCEDVRDSGLTSDKTPAAILNCHFDIRDFLNFRIETSVLKDMNMEEKQAKRLKSEPKKENNVGVVEINGSISQKELSDYISQKMMELFNKDSVQPSEDVKYVVKKVYANTDQSTDIRTCNTEEEAVKFVENIKRDYPELLETCNFIVCKAKKNGKEK